MPSADKIVLRVVRSTLVLLALAAPACGVTSRTLTPSGSFTTLMAGWEKKFNLEWSVEPEVGDGQRIRGYVSSQYGQAAERVRLLAQGLDPSGAPLAQRIWSLPGAVVGFGRAYFEIPHLPKADHYLVTVWDYTIHEAEGTIR